MQTASMIEWLPRGCAMGRDIDTPPQWTPSQWDPIPKPVNNFAKFASIGGGAIGRESIGGVSLRFLKSSAH